MYKKIQYWQFIPMEKRFELRKKFGIKPSNPTSIENNKVVIDGISEADIDSIPLDELQLASGIDIKEYAATSDKALNETVIEPSVITEKTEDELLAEMIKEDEKKEFDVNNYIK
jgi:hypothetical protein